MKLTTLAPRLKPISTRRSIAVATAAVAERLRGSAGVKDRQSIKRRDHGLCRVCKRPGYIVDHIIPLWEGGSDEDDNKQLICAPCHDAKSAVEAKRRASGG